MLLKPKMLLFSKRIMKFYTLFKTQDLENHTLFSGTYPYRPNKGVLPPPRRRARFVALLKSVRILCIKFWTPRLSVGQYYQAIFGQHLVNMAKKSKFLSKGLTTVGFIHLELYLFIGEPIIGRQIGCQQALWGALGGEWEKTRACSLVSGI